MDIQKNKTFSALIMLVTVLIGGTFAFLLVEEDWTFLDALYMTVISVTTVGFGEVQPLSSEGRIVAMLVILAGLGIVGLIATQIATYAVSGELGGSFERRRIAKTISSFSGHTIVCGYGSRGECLTSSLLIHHTNTPNGNNQTIVVIESQTDSPTLNKLKIQGVPVIHGNASNQSILDLAGINRASQVIIVAGSDETNLIIAQEVSESVSKISNSPEIIAGIESYTARSFFADKVSQNGIKVMGFRKQAFLLMAMEFAINIIKNIDQIPQAPHSILVDVDETIREELLRALIMVFQIAGNQKPIITVHSSSDAFRSGFIETFPEYFSCALIEWEYDFLQSDSGKTSKADLAIFSLGTDFATLEAAERFLLRNPNLAQHQVVACVRDNGSVQKLALLPDTYKRSPLVVSLLQFIENNAEFSAHAMEGQGKELHENYRASVMPGKDPGNWEGLSEFLRESNRMAALNQPIIKLLWGKLIEAGMENKAALDYLTVTEHMRWMAFHVMSGWRKDTKGIKDRKQRAMLKLHPDIVPFDMLDEPTKEYDLNNVLKALGND